MLLRLRIVATVILVAIAAVLAVVPLPLWMVVAVCGLLLLATAVTVFRVADQGLRQTET